LKKLKNNFNKDKKTEDRIYKKIDMIAQEKLVKHYKINQKFKMK
jgi:hypothetical protein